MPLVKLYANLRNLAGTRELPITGATIGAVVQEMVRQNPALEDIIIENGELRPHIIITLNGHNVMDINMQVEEKDEIAIFPPIAGG